MVCYRIKIVRTGILERISVNCGYLGFGFTTVCLNLPNFTKESIPGPTLAVTR